ASVEGICPDLSSLESVREAVKGIHDTYGRIDILVNNAGVSDSVPFTEYTEELFDKVMNLNVKGVFNASRAVVDYMVEQGEGVILSTSSMVSISGQAAGVAYPTSKFAVNGMTISLARELGPKGIRGNEIGRAWRTEREGGKVGTGDSEEKREEYDRLTVTTVKRR